MDRLIHGARWKTIDPSGHGQGPEVSHASGVQNRKRAFFSNQLADRFRQRNARKEPLTSCGETSDELSDVAVFLVIKRARPQETEPQSSVRIRVPLY